jgi:membrane-bound lytic murein transglycosylase B
MLKIHRLFILVGIIFVIIIAFSIDVNNDKLDVGFSSWKNKTAETLQANGVSEAVIKTFKDSVQKDSSYLKNLEESSEIQDVVADAKNYIDDDMLLKSQMFYTNNKKLLSDYALTYNVDYPSIVAIFGIGSKFGEDTGLYKVVNLLSNLSYDSANSEYYTNELIYFLKLVDQGTVDFDVLGDKNGTFSYLGIMPSMYYLYGVDGDKDGTINLFVSKEDILHTGFSMLKRLAWAEGLPILSSVSNPQGLNLKDQEGIKYLLNDNANNQSLQKSKNVEYWVNLGLVSDKTFNVDSDVVASVIMSGSNRDGVMLYNNFNLLFRGINVLDKSIAIGLLAQEVVKYVSLVNYKDNYVEGVEKTKYNPAKGPKKDDKPSAYSKYEGLK